MVGPSVLGTAAAGKQLTGLSGTWGGFDAITYHFQWYRCNAAGAGCLSVHGATSPTYSLGNRDIGKTLGLTVYATDSTGTASAFSSLIGPIAPSRPLLESTAQPLVTGPPAVGKVIQVTTGNWSPTPPTLAYRWERCNANARACAAIANATTSSYTVARADARALAARDRAGDERLDDPERVQHGDAGRRAARGPRPAADREPDASTAPRSWGSRSARRPGSGRVSARSRSRSAGIAATLRAPTARRFPAPPRTSTRWAPRTPAGRSASR